MSKNLSLIALVIAMAVFGTATYARDRSAAQAQDNIARIQVDDTMLTMFLAPVGIVQSLLDESAIYNSMQ